MQERVTLKLCCFTMLVHVSPLARAADSCIAGFCHASLMASPLARGKCGFHGYMVAVSPLA